MAKKRRRRVSGAALGAARAPQACKTRLSACMRGKGGRRKASACMKQFNRCRGV